LGPDLWPVFFFCPFSDYFGSEGQVVSVFEVGDWIDRLGLPISSCEVASTAEPSSVHVAQVSLIPPNDFVADLTVWSG
jgi:hypothetical protein